MPSLLETTLNPWVLFFGVIALAWLWEDAALISGALLAVEQKLSVPIAMTAIFLGICSGDLGLYYLGRLAHRWRRLRAWILLNPNNRSLARRFRRSTMTNIMIIRFIPGLRTVGFTLCGLWRVSLMRFLVAMSVAGLFWIATIFSLIYAVGSSAWLENSDWKWSLMALALALLIINNIWASRAVQRSSRTRKVN